MLMSYKYYMSFWESNVYYTEREREREREREIVNTINTTHPLESFWSIKESSRESIICEKKGY